MNKQLEIVAAGLIECRPVSSAFKNKDIYDYAIIQWRVIVRTLALKLFNEDEHINPHEFISACGVNETAPL